MKHQKSFHNRIMHGFTLIEIIIAMMIFSVLTLLINQTISRTIFHHKSHKMLSDQLLELQTSVNILQNDLEQITNYEVISKHLLPEPLFKQNGTQLHFMRRGFINPQDLFERSTLQEVRYDLVNGQLMRYTKNRGPHLEEGKVILSGILNLHWSFLGPDKKWYNLWPPTEHWKHNIPYGIMLDIDTQAFGKIKRIYLNSIAELKWQKDHED